jgi:hypothetical protein
MLFFNGKKYGAVQTSQKERVRIALGRLARDVCRRRVDPGADPRRARCVDAFEVIHAFSAIAPFATRV